MSLKPPIAPTSGAGSVLDAFDVRLDDLEAETGSIFSVTDPSYGAVGTGLADESTEVQAAFTAALAAGGGTVYFPEGTYKINTALTYAGSNLTVECAPGVVFDASDLAASGSFFTVAGSEPTSGDGYAALSGNAAKAATSVSVTAGQEAEFAEGDYIKVGVDGAISYPSTCLFTPNTSSSGELDQRIGEIGVVASTSSGSITPRWPLLGGTYNTSDTAFVAKLTMRENITWRGGTIIGGGTGSNHAALSFDRCFNVKVLDVVLKDFDDRGVHFRDVLHGLVDGITVLGGESVDNNFYGVVFNHACQWGKVVNSTFRDNRHAITCGGSTARSGINRFITYANNHAYDATATAFDSHAGTEHLTITGNHAYSCSSGVNLRCPSAIVSNNTVIGSLAQAVYMRNQTAKPTSHLVQGNRIVGAGTVGIYCREPADAELDATAAGQDIDHIIIANNAIEGTPEQGIYCISAESFSLHSVSIVGNTVRSATLSPIRLDKVDGANITGNTLTDVLASQRAIRLADVTLSVVSGNVLRAASATSSTGVAGLPADDIVVSGNLIDGFATGVSSDADSTNWTITGNNTRTCTADTSLSGTGNITTANQGVTTQTYAATNVTPDRAYDADTVLVAELADIVGTLIADLRAQGIVA